MIRIKLAMVAVMLIAVLAAKGEAILHWFQGGSCGDSTNTALPAIACEAAAIFSHREHHMHQHSSCHCSTFLAGGSSVVEMRQQQQHAAPRQLQQQVACCRVAS
jgi:hypothetical protein